ncbi:hypothetical protein P9J83_18090 [Clostridium sporogenes]|uniref:Phorbol-ester/DAG-type domain-containing protein n=1 Tax=Clostridium sporogenes TaxID=1509 RepID=A0AAE4JWP4_CLOSG|nr:hypothetical protein [Clostridium sporogenes]MDS1005379.1 hypothetical protein [Clostridium sporogenes]
MYRCDSCGYILGIEDETFHCENCGEVICEECFERNEGLCNSCYIDLEVR